MATDDVQEVVAPMCGFLQTTLSMMHRWEMSLLSPWDMSSMQGGRVGYNKKFEEAAIQARS